MRVGVFIGRFQPLHDGHRFIIDTMLEECDTCHIIVGSVNSTGTIRNPWTYTERYTAINREYPNVKISPVNDTLYHDEWWVAAITTILSVYKPADVYIYGFTKPGNYYLEWFPLYHYVEVKSDINIHATGIRHQLASEGKLPVNVQEEWDFYQKEKELFANYPYKETLQFVCSDALLHSDDKVLLVKRKFAPGKDKWALPGGFKNANETSMECAFRELKEETGINVIYNDIDDGTNEVIVYDRLYDSPKRNFGGIQRITTCYFMDIIDPDEFIHTTNPADDAELAAWFPLAVAINHLDMFHDHRDILLDMTASLAEHAHTLLQYSGIIDEN